MKQHFIGATYELTQANMNGLILQLEGSRSDVKKLQSCLQNTLSYLYQLELLVYDESETRLIHKTVVEALRTLEETK